VFPGLCGIVPVESKHVAVVFVDKLPNERELHGLLMLTPRTDESGSISNNWLIQVQGGLLAWQFMTVDDHLPDLIGHVVLLEWRSGHLGMAIDKHHRMIETISKPEDWLVGSQIEIEAYSNYALATGMSTLSHPYQADGTISRALNAPGRSIELYGDPISKACAYPVRWFEV
jgi:hypothetical protein